jgi:hypothetical protein
MTSLTSDPKLAQAGSMLVELATVPEMRDQLAPIWAARELSQGAQERHELALKEARNGQ